VILIVITGSALPHLDLEVILDSSMELVFLQVLINFSLQILVSHIPEGANSRIML
jgi:hypothetical protein